MKRSIPKDIENFDAGNIASAQLIHLALERILFAKAKVRWTVTVRYYQTEDEISQDKCPVVCTRFSSSNAGPKYRKEHP